MTEALKNQNLRLLKAFLQKKKRERKESERRELFDMLPRRQPPESIARLAPPLSVRKIGDETANDPADHLQKINSRPLATEKLFKRKISTRLQQKSEYDSDNDCGIKLVIDQHHPHSNHNVKIFANGTPETSKKTVYDLDRRKAHMKDILKPAGTSHDVRHSKSTDYRRYLHFRIQLL